MIDGHHLVCVSRYYFRQYVPLFKNGSKDFFQLILIFLVKHIFLCDTEYQYNIPCIDGL